jgi:hypothetical protein
MLAEKACREYGNSRRQLLGSAVGRDVRLNSVASQKKVFVVFGGNSKGFSE